MQEFSFPVKKNACILALGAESAGNFSVFQKGKIFLSEDFGDLLEEADWRKYKLTLSNFLKKNKIEPEIIITDLHPLYQTTALGIELAEKFKAEHVQVQHHMAHIFSAVGENMINSKSNKLKAESCGIALDGTGYGLDDKIWGGEVFEVKSQKTKVQSIRRIGKLEDQAMVGGDLAVKEPARMLISILSKFLPKDEVYGRIKKYYSRNQFEVLYNQLRSGFNCQETSSAGRVLDAVSILLGFCKNERNFKHEPTMLLEQNYTIPYQDLKPKLNKIEDKKIPVTSYELLVTPLFEYLLSHLSRRDKRRLAATAQLYIAQGLYAIAKKFQVSNFKLQVVLAGGIANNKIISDYLISKGAIVNKEIPRGDAGISFGQIIYFILQK